MQPIYVIKCSWPSSSKKHQKTSICCRTFEFDCITLLNCGFYCVHSSNISRQQLHHIIYVISLSLSVSASSNLSVHFRPCHSLPVQQYSSISSHHSPSHLIITCQHACSSPHLIRHPVYSTYLLTNTKLLPGLE